MEIKKIKISPEVLKLDLSAVTYSAETFGYFPPLVDILSGGTNGDSLLTDLSIPILLTQNFEDIGYYSPFDGDLSQCKEDVNFLFEKGDASKKICVYNTSDKRIKYLKKTTFQINWGDGSAINDIGTVSICHTYPNVANPTSYKITISGQTPSGILSITKNVTVPFDLITPTNTLGTVTFANNNGSWSATPISQNYLNSFDSNNTIAAQVSSNFIPVPFIISGYTNSRLSELFIYGPNKLGNVGTAQFPLITLKDGTTGKTDSVSNDYTAYTINGMSYLDFPKGKSVFIVESYGITSDMIVESAITKFDFLMNIINDTEIQSNVFIERGKNSGIESFRRIGEVGSTGELETYGYNFFDVRNFNDI